MQHGIFPVVCIPANAEDEIIFGSQVIPYDGTRCSLFLLPTRSLTGGWGRLKSETLKTRLYVDNGPLETLRVLQHLDRHLGHTPGLVAYGSRAA